MYRVTFSGVERWGGGCGEMYTAFFDVEAEVAEKKRSKEVEAGGGVDGDDVFRDLIYEKITFTNFQCLANRDFIYGI